MAAETPAATPVSEATSTLVESNFESDAHGQASSLRSITQTPLPLTTIYTPPPSCSSIVTWDGTDLWQYGVNQTGGDCYPPDFLSIYDSYYTPGICPHAWTSAGTVSHSSGFDAMCCPKGFFLSAHSGYACASIFSNVLNNVYSTLEAGNDPIPPSVSLTSVDPNNGAMTVTADVIQVQWQNKDQKIISLLSAQTASASSTTAPKTGSRQTASTPVATDQPQISSQSSSGGLSTGAKVGIGVAVPIVVLALLGFGLFFLFSRRKSRAARRDQEAAAEKRQPAYQELSQNGHEYPNLENQPPQEMDAAQPNELPADGITAEIGGREMQRLSTFKESAIKDSQYKDRALQEENPRMPTKKILR